MIGSKIFRRYAKALLSLGQEDGHYEEYGQNLQEFGGFCSANEEFFQVISNPVFSVEDRMKILEAVLEKSTFSNTAQNFLKILLEKNRISGIKEISDYFSQLIDKVLNIARADIITAKPLKEDTLNKLEKALRGLTSQDVKIEMKEDESLIGGVVVRIGDLVLDGSVKTQLETMKETLTRGEYY